VEVFLYVWEQMDSPPVSCCGTRRMSSVTGHLRPSPSVCGSRQKLRMIRHACFCPTTAHTALALDSATGGGQARDRCHSLRSLDLPPVALPSLPIPNTEVKLMYADNTWRATARENR